MGRGGRGIGNLVVGRNCLGDKGYSGLVSPWGFHLGDFALGVCFGGFVVNGFGNGLGDLL